MEVTPQPDTVSILPDEVHAQVWDRISARLERGDALITNNDFCSALLTEYQAVTGSDASDTLRDLLRDAVIRYNREYPEHFVAHGLQNGVARAFQTGVSRLEWDVIAIKSAGERSIARFKSQDRVRGLLQEMKVSPDQIDARACVLHAIAVTSGIKEPLVKHPADEPVEPAVAPAALAAAEIGDEAQEAIRGGEVSQADADTRAVEQSEARAAIERLELARAPQHVDSFVEQGLITSEEGETVRQLHEIDQRCERGEIDENEAERLRDSLMGKDARYALERKMHAAVDHSVRFLQVFEAMKRIATAHDEALRFLIHHKSILNQEPLAASQAVSELLEDSELASGVIEVMDRKDHEIRMISVCLPPYSHIVTRGAERIENLVIEEEFVDDLRKLSGDEISERLNSAEPGVRVRPAADMKCLIAIISPLHVA